MKASARGQRGKIEGSEAWHEEPALTGYLVGIGLTFETAVTLRGRLSLEDEARRMHKDAVVQKLRCRIEQMREALAVVRILITSIVLVVITIRLGGCFGVRSRCGRTQGKARGFTP